MLILLLQGATQKYFLLTKSVQFYAKENWEANKRIDTGTQFDKTPNLMPKIKANEEVWQIERESKECI